MRCLCDRTMSSLCSHPPLPFKRCSSQAVHFVKFTVPVYFSYSVFVFFGSGGTQKFTQRTKIQRFLTLGIVADRKSLQLCLCKGTKCGCYFKTNLKRLWVTFYQCNLFSTILQKLQTNNSMQYITFIKVKTYWIYLLYNPYYVRVFECYFLKGE